MPETEVEIGLKLFLMFVHGCRLMLVTDALENGKRLEPVVYRRLFV
jgi:hypothetical protein